MIVTRTTRFGYYARLLILLTSLTIIACSDVPPALKTLDDYRHRIATPQNLELNQLEIPPVQRPPGLREMRVPVPNVSMSLLDSLRLDTCAVGASIVQRNSALGRLESGLRRYHGDLQLIIELKTCLAQLEDTESDLGQRLQTALDSKRMALPLLKQQALVSDDALRHALSPANQSSERLPTETIAESIEALRVVVQLLTFDTAEPSRLIAAERLEQALETLETSNALPYLWRNQHELISGLRQSHALVIDAGSRSGCASKGVPQRAQILRNVFSNYFAAGVQAQVAQLTSHAYRVNPLINELQQHSKQQLFDDYLVNLQGLSSQLTLAIKTHAEHWQQFFQDCDFQPGSIS